MKIKGLISLKIAAYLNLIINVILFYVFLKSENIFLFPCVFIIPFSAYYIHRYLSNKYTQKVNEKLIPSIFKSYNFTFNSKKGIEQDIIDNSGMIKIGNKYKSSNLLTGKYNDVKFKQSDILVKDVHYFTMIILLIFTRSFGAAYEKIFQGRWYVFTFNKKILKKLYVRDKSCIFTALNVKETVKGVSRIKTESTVFNSEFLIDAQNAHEAFYVLTPNIMENILELKQNIKGKLMLGFIDNELHIAISKPKNIYKYNIFKRLDYNTISKGIYNDYKVIVDFIEKLELDNDIFK